MLNAQYPPTRKVRRQSQQGVVLLVALIVLVIMALATAALMRSVSSTSAIAGNLAFQQAAITSADQGMEAAVIWLENNHGQSSSATADACDTGSTVLACDQSSHGYIATRSDPGSTQTWADLWTSLVAAGSKPVSQATDAAGNTTAYLIQRMCSAAGDASTDTGCAIQPTSTECGNSKTIDAAVCSSQVYYRITVKTTGPRNTVSFTQAMVAL